ncbi:DUF5908 family protein [Chitinophaga lutea]
MPIIIRELVVKANVAEASVQQGTQLSAPAAGISEGDRLRIIEEAVQQVMEMLERQKER